VEIDQLMLFSIHTDGCKAEITQFLSLEGNF